MVATLRHDRSATRFLNALHVDGSQHRLAALFEGIAAKPWPSLRELHLEHHDTLADATPMWRSLPRLTHLTIDARDATLEQLPTTLEVLYLGGLPGPVFETLGRQRFPVLRDLDLVERLAAASTRLRRHAHRTDRGPGAGAAQVGD